MLALDALWAGVAAQEAPQITREMLAHAVRVAGESFSDAELDAIIERANENLRTYADLHRVPLENSVAPPLYFNPVVPGMTIDRVARPLRRSRQRVGRPGGAEDIAYLPVTALAELLRTRQLTSVELTRIYLDRLARYGPRLQYVVTLTEERALRQAAQADAEIASGRYRGPLHGIPWGVKDLFATRGYPTSWGAAPFKAQVLDVDATVVARLDAAGAVLVAKLATGELAIDDVWFVNWTLDKVGPMCRSAEDCALVLAAIHGPDDQDLSVQAVPFNWDARTDVRRLRIGYLKAAFENTRQTPQTDANDARALETLRRLGITPIEVRLPEGPAVPTIAILYAESNAALKDPVRTSPEQLVRKDRTAWQNSFRVFPASDYLDANRARAILMREMARVMSDVDVYVTPFDYAD